MYLDIRDFPVVRMGNDPADNVPIDTLLAQISDLLERDRPFVFISEMDSDNGQEKGNVDDRRKVALWMKANRTPIRQLIKGHIQVVTDAGQRAEFMAFAAGFEKFWGYPMFVVATVPEAQDKALSLLRC